MSTTLETNVGPDALRPVLVEPEWLSVEAAARLSGLSRSFLYELINEGRIRSASIRRRGAQRGRRLVCTDGLRAFISSQVDKAAEPLEGGLKQ